MLNLFDKIRQSEKGDALVEFAAAIPFLLIIFVGLMETGRAFMQANAIEKSMRAAAVYAARVDNPSSSASRTIIENLVKTGSMDGTASLLVEGWSDSSASLTIAESIYVLDGQNMPVITLTASVPFAPIIPEIAAFVGLDGYRMVLSHEQAYVDN